MVAFLVTERLQQLVEEVWKSVELRERLLEDMEEVLEEIGVDSPEDIAEWRTWQNAHFCGCYDDIVRACACG